METKAGREWPSLGGCPSEVSHAEPASVPFSPQFLQLNDQISGELSASTKHISTQFFSQRHALTQDMSQGLGSTVWRPGPSICVKLTEVKPGSEAALAYSLTFF